MTQDEMSISVEMLNQLETLADRRGDDVDTLVSQLLNEHMLFNTIPDIVCQIGEDGRFLQINPAFGRLLGYDMTEVIGQALLHFIHPDDRDKTRQMLLLASDRKTDYLNELTNRYITKTGDTCWIMWHGFYDPAQATWYATGRDVTARQQFNYTAPDDHTTRDILESITSAFFALDHNWQFVYVNQEAEAVLQRRRQTLINQNIWEQFPGTVGSTFESEYRRAMQTGQSTSFEAYYPPLNTWFEVNAYPSEQTLAVYFRDINDRKQLEEALQRAVGDLELRVRERTAELTEANKLLRRQILVREQAEREQDRFVQILENTSDFVCITDSDGHILRLM
jgi:PAS domain S-box-containing protein